MIGSEPSCNIQGFEVTHDETFHSDYLSAIL